jgi:maltose/maltodextrin transport system permease protein
MTRGQTRTLLWSAAAIVALVSLYLVYEIYASGNAVLAAAVAGFAAVGFFIYTFPRAYTVRYLFPGLAGLAIFVVLPLVYTITIGFTNHGSSNLLSFPRATKVLLSEIDDKRQGTSYEFNLHPDGARFRLVLTAAEEAAAPAESGGSVFDLPADTGAGSGDAGAAAGSAGSGSAGSAGSAGAAAGSAGSGSAGSAGSAAGGAAAPKPPAVFVTPPLDLSKVLPQQIKAVPLAGSGFVPGEPAPLKEVVDRDEPLQALTIVFPDGTSATKVGMREFRRQELLYVQNADGSLTNQQIGVRITPNFDTGFYETPDHEQIRPGFRVNVGGANFKRIFTEDKFRGPFFRVFLWTVVFSALTVVLTVAIGMLLAELLSWEALRLRGVYRILLFLPYAVPSFISILVFKGLFNQNFGEINLILDGLFGIRPSWVSDPTLAKLMILIVNTWLGYPYFMMLCMGLQKSIPSDLYEASALAGAGPLTNFFKITWPLIRKPLTPLMIASFAFNFNNFVLITLLTNGRPDFLDTPVPAGETDLLVTYTYRIAFESRNYGLAAAISTMIFVIVAILSIVNLRLTKVTAEDKR